MPSFIDYTPEQRFIALFIGPSGCGKTCAEGSFQNEADQRIVDFMDFDGRIGGLQGATWLTEAQKRKIKYTYYPPRDTKLVDKVNSKLEGLLVSSNMGQPIPQTLAMDSLTSQTYAALTYAVPLTHAGNKGKSVGPVQMAGPEDYGVEATITYGILSFLRTIPIPNVICTAHVIPTYGKLNPNDPYSASVENGEKISLRDKISANVMIYFDHVFRFDKKMRGLEERYSVTFRSDIARTSYSWLPTGEHDWTGQNFYEFMYSFRKGK